MYRGKGYYEILVLVSMLCVHFLYIPVNVIIVFFSLGLRSAGDFSSYGVVGLQPLEGTWLTIIL